jgi:hypothetical protein
MYHLKPHADAVAWSPLDFSGVSLRVLHTDPDTGAMTVLTRMVPGAVIPAHLHTRADETVYVLEGDFVEDGHPSNRLRGNGVGNRGGQVATNCLQHHAGTLRSAGFVDAKKVAAW